MRQYYVVCITGPIIYLLKLLFRQLRISKSTNFANRLYIYRFSLDLLYLDQGLIKDHVKLRNNVYFLPRYFLNAWITLKTEGSGFGVAVVLMTCDGVF